MTAIEDDPILGRFFDTADKKAKWIVRVKLFYIMWIVFVIIGFILYMVLFFFY